MQDIIQGYKKAFSFFSAGIGNLALLGFINIAITIFAVLLLYVFMIIGFSAISFGLGLGGDVDPEIATIITILVVMVGVGILVLLYGFIIVFGSVMQASMMYLVDDVAQEKTQKGISYYLKKGWEVKWQLIGVNVLMFLVIAIGFIFFIIPGIIASFFLSFAAYSLLFEHTGVTDSLKRSYSIVKNQFGDYFLRALLFGLFVMVGTGISSFIPFANIAVQLFIGAFVICYYYVLFNDLHSALPKESN